MRLVALLLLGGCAWRPSPELLERYRQTCAAGGGSLAWGVNSNNAKLNPEDFWLRCAGPKDGAVPEQGVFKWNY